MFPKRMYIQGDSDDTLIGNIQDSIKMINSAGGKVLGEPVEIPGVGTYISFTDTEGNRVSILQPKM